MDSWLSGMKQQQALHKLTGVSAFRKHQSEAITAVVQGRDVMLIMATGGGKSVTFQLPPLVLNRGALIISPTIAIMKDQVTALNQKGLSACFLGSASTSEMRAGAYAGNFQFVYVTPEYLTTRTTTQLHQLHSACKFCLVAMDEAHCVADTGRGFRPAFSQLHRLRDPGCPIHGVPWIAVTATAGPAVQTHISAALALRDPLVLCGSVERPNLHLSCLRKPCEDRAQAARILCDMICGDHTPLVACAANLGSNGVIASAIVYCVSRAEVRELSRVMQADTRLAGKVGAYSAEQSAQERAETQDAFNRGVIRVLVATSAFGLGVNKPDVRWIINWGPPGDMQAYFQMIGRAGRDYMPARCVLFWSAGGISSRKFLQRQDSEAGASMKGESDAFDTFMNFVQAPKGCRHAQLTQHFVKKSNIESETAALNGICHGGCDVCDARMAALRDLSVPSCHILRTIADAPDAMLEHAVLQQVVAKADQAQAPGADLQHVNAFWVGLLHQLLKLGLIRRCDSQAPDQALAVQLTMAGVQELDGLVAAGNKHMQAQHMGALDGSGLRSTRLSCSKALVQSLMQPLGEHSRKEKGLDGQVRQGRQGLEQLCAVLENEKLLPTTFRGMLPCITVDGSVSDLPRDMLRLANVDLGLWACMGKIILCLARGCDPGAMLQSEAFISARKKWIGPNIMQTSSIRREVIEAAHHVQAKAVHTHKAVMRARVALGKLARKLDRQGKLHPERPSAVLTAKVCDEIAKAAPMTEADLEKIQALPADVNKSHGTAILHLLHEAFEEERCPVQKRTRAAHHIGDENSCALLMVNPERFREQAVPAHKHGSTALQPAAMRFAKKRKR